MQLLDTFLLFGGLDAVNLDEVYEFDLENYLVDGDGSQLDEVYEFDVDNFGWKRGPETLAKARREQFIVGLQEGILDC